MAITKEHSKRFLWENVDGTKKQVELSSPVNNDFPISYFGCRKEGNNVWDTCGPNNFITEENFQNFTLQESSPTIPNRTEFLSMISRIPVQSGGKRTRRRHRKKKSGRRLLKKRSARRHRTCRK